MTVKETINSLTNNGYKKVYNDRTRKYVNNQDVWDVEVVKVTYHNGYGYAQVNAVVHINM